MLCSCMYTFLTISDTLCAGICLMHKDSYTYLHITKSVCVFFVQEREARLEQAKREGRVLDAEYDVDDEDYAKAPEEARQLMISKEEVRMDDGGTR